MLTADETFMRRALELAKLGQGNVEPNPMVGCVLVCDGKVVGEGYHEDFGGPHAEVNALANAAELGNAVGTLQTPTTAYVTLEPCSHTGKTGPCCEALIESQVSRVVVAIEDPNPLVRGKGIEKLKQAGIGVVTGVLEPQARKILGPFLKRMERGKPWIIAKWAMTLDGRIATSTGDSKWISSESSRQLVHQIRDRVDAVMVGIGTVLADDPMLNARLDSQEQSTRKPALRVVCDSTAKTPLNSKLVETAREIPTLIAVGPEATTDQCDQLRDAGCEVFQSEFGDPDRRLDLLLQHLSQQQITNVLVEGGGRLLGSLNDLKEIDEVHCFIAPKVIGGADAVSPILGTGFDLINNALNVEVEKVEQLDGDMYLMGLTTGHF